MNIKRLLALTAVGALLIYASCIHSGYTHTVYGTYYDDGVVVTDDGNMWEYDDKIIADNTPVAVSFDDNGTPDITDDIIINLEVLQ